MTDVQKKEFVDIYNSLRLLYEEHYIEESIYIEGESELLRSIIGRFAIDLNAIGGIYIAESEE